ncbi:MAG: hypothetical protein QME81_16315 [bacterium]|nr:hypothetical protein [bacterium]
MSQLVLEYQGEVSVENSIKSALDREVRALEMGISLSKKALKQFEKKYKMPSEEFFTKMEEGELGDSLDFIEWAGECELLLRTEQKFEALKGIRICA